MGTSLSGLTPQTTFDGLLKTSDNDALDATLKTIGTGDGTDSILQLSNSALSIGGTFNVDGGIATFKGVGSSHLTSSFIIKNSADAEIFRVRDDQQIFANYINGQSVSASDYALYGAAYAPNIRVNIKGSGATSATTSLLVQNSAGTDMLKLTDDGIIQAQNLEINGGATSPLIFAQGNTGKSIRLGNEAFISSFNRVDIKTWDGTAYSEAMRITGNTDQFVGIGETTPTARLHVKGSGNTNTTTSLLVQNSNGADVLQTLDNGSVGVGTPANSAYRVTMTSGVLRLKDLLFGQTGSTSINNTNLLTMKWNGSTGIGISDSGAIDATARLHIKGEAPSGIPLNNPTALLVQNSAGSDLLKVTDDGVIDFGVLGLDFSNDGSGGTISVASDRYIKLATSLSTYSALNAHVFKTSNGSTYTEIMRITGNSDQFVGIGESTPTARLQVKGSGATSATFALKAQNSGGETMFSIRDDKTIQIDGSRFTFNSSAFTSYADILLNTDLAVGTTTIAANTRAHIKGSGATSATTALLVENSAGTDLLKVLDDGQLEIKSNSGSVSTTSGTSIFSYSSGGGGVLDVNPSNGNSVKFRVRGDNDIYLIQSNPAGDNIGIGASSPDSTAKLQVDSTTQGFLPPRMTSEQKMTIASPAAGLMVYDTDQNQMNYWNGSGWIAF